ncbi:hypothetical protein [Actinopolymorpha alba]|uniref:hypothetical protein n=1 Tax=Actinopolymorpha alba TaxID=533267 RepID=UPI0003751508|nr:hypothetical protein [Actinopolymorpha alba]
MFGSRLGLCLRDVINEHHRPEGLQRNEGLLSRFDPTTVFISPAVRWRDVPGTTSLGVDQECIEWGVSTKASYEPEKLPVGLARLVAKGLANQIVDRLASFLSIYGPMSKAVPRCIFI